MAKEKLFTPEDFDKPKDKSFWQKYKNRIISCIAAAALVVGIIASVKSCDTQKEVKDEEQEQTEQVAEGAQTQVSNEGSETMEAETTPETQEVESVEEQTTATPEVATPKEEPKPEATPAKPVTQPDNVSDNVEQEAMNVIRGDYGNVPERRQKLGSKYQEIQNRVNQLKKEGVF